MSPGTDFGNNPEALALVLAGPALAEAPTVPPRFFLLTSQGAGGGGGGGVGWTNSRVGDNV